MNFTEAFKESRGYALALCVTCKNCVSLRRGKSQQSIRSQKSLPHAPECQSGTDLLSYGRSKPFIRPLVVDIRSRSPFAMSNDFAANKWIFTSYEAPFLFVHASVTAFLSAQVRKRNKAFSTAFYFIYLQQSVIKYIGYVVVRCRQDAPSW